MPDTADDSQELIKIKGFQVAPAELEAVLLEHDDVDDAAVVGVSLSVSFHFMIFLGNTDFV